MRDIEEKIVYSIPAPYMEDSAGLTSDSVSYTLHQVDGGLILVVEADADWINDEDRSFPVSIDPTLTMHAGHMQDEIYITYIDEGSPTATHMSDQHIYFGYGYHDTVKERRLFLHFNSLPDIPAGSVIIDAQFMMYMFSLTYQGCEELGTALYPVTEDKGAYDSYYDWMCHFCWNTQPAYDDSNMIDYTVIDGAPSNGPLYRYYNWDMTELVKAWYTSETENRTAALAITPSTTAYGPSYCSVPVFMAYGNTYPPIMAVSYRNNTGIESYYSYATLGGGEAGTAYIADATGQMKIAKSLISYASTINPFVMSLVYNSDYFSVEPTQSYQAPEKLGLSMQLGEGWTLDIIRKIEEETIENTKYLKYTDGDGTVHYFVGVMEGGSTIYYDEDGLGLKITPSGTTTYTMTDRQDNVFTFTGGFLTNGWTLGSGGEFRQFWGMEQENGIAIAAVIPSAPWNANANVSQSVTVNLPGGATYVLSGWAFGNAVPDNTDLVADHAQDTVKSFGLRAVLTYSDGTKEYHYAPFNADIAEWQFTSMAIVPQKPTGVVATITVMCVFERNGNSATFDNISLTRQSVQKMDYDDEGNLSSVSTTGVAGEGYTYENGNLTRATTSTGGTIEYSYADDDYAHRLTSYTDTLTTTTLTYDAVGNVGMTVRSAESCTSSFRSSATYTNNGNLTATVTDVNGITTTYQYDTERNKMLGLPSMIQDANQTATSILYDNFGRTTETNVANLATLCYYYTNGNLAQVSRIADAKAQNYNFTYDAFGNVLSMKIGAQTVATYVYGNGNGPMLRQTYGNGDVVSFTYDMLGRTKTATFDDGRVVTYIYNGEGQLSSAVESGVGTPVTYSYVCDMEGRLIVSEKYEGSSVAIRVMQQYNEAGQLVGQSWTVGGVTSSETYTYNQADGTLKTMTTAAGQTLQMEYDYLRRLSDVSAGLYDLEYAYVNQYASITTNQVSNLCYTGLHASIYFGYSYDAAGNIAQYRLANGEVITYTYDALGQLLSAVGDATYTYTYDNAGNILTANGHTYTYTDSNWRDRLSTFDGRTITYDAAGNPLSYYNGTQWSFSWANGRNLASATDGTTNVRYTYDDSGLRMTKRVGAVTHKYYYAGGKLLRETYGGNTLDFCYNAQGYPYALRYNGTVYYYITNLQGDVMHLVDGSGAVVASYEYDPYGNIVSSSGAMAEINPLRYRGYYYDADTGFYYLQSRYYDPKICRFIHADSYASTGQGVLGNNMFAYCNNDPVNLADTAGRLPHDSLANDQVYTHSGDGRFRSIRIPTPPLLGPVEKPQNPDAGTRAVGITASAVAIAGVGISIGVTYDKGGNVGLIVSLEGVCGGISANAGVFETNMNCANIYDQRGLGASAGAAGNIAGLGVSADVLVGMTDDWQSNGYLGHNIAATLGIGMPSDAHGAISYSWVFCSFNIYDMWNSFYDWVS